MSLSENFWIVLALVAAIGSAGMMLVTEYFKIRALHLLFMLRIIVLVLLFPEIFFLAWPESPRFYIFVLSTVLIFVYTDLKVFGMAAKNGAGVVSRTEPLSVIPTFVLWTALNPAVLDIYLSSPVRAGGILLSLAAATHFVLKLRRCAISMDTIKELVGPILAVSIGVACAKFAIDSVENVYIGAYYYTFIQSCAMLLVYITLMKVPFFTRIVPDFGMSSKLFSRRVFIAGLCMTFFHLIHMMAKYPAFAAVNNPSYVTVVALTGPLWIVFAYKLAGRKEPSDIMNGLGVVASVISLIIFTNF